MKDIDWCVALFFWYVLSGFGIRIMLISKVVGKHSFLCFMDVFGENWYYLSPKAYGFIDEIEDFLRVSLVN